MSLESVTSFLHAIALAVFGLTTLLDKLARTAPCGIRLKKFSRPRAAAAQTQRKNARDHA